MESPANIRLKSKDEIITVFFKLVAKHGVQKNDKGTPWGLSFFDDSKNGHVFLRKFKITSPVEVPKLKKVS